MVFGVLCAWGVREEDGVQLITAEKMKAMQNIWKSHLAQPETIVFSGGKTGAFVMDAYNYQTVDDEGTPLYTMNNPEAPIEIAPAGMSIQVSREYFKWNPIETEDGSELDKQIVLDDLTLNLLVPDQYRDMEQEILAAWREILLF